MTGPAAAKHAVAFRLGEGRVHVHLPGADLVEPVGSLFPDYRRGKVDAGEGRVRVVVDAVDSGFRVRAPARFVAGGRSPVPGAAELVDGSETVPAGSSIGLLTVLEGVLTRALLESRSDRVHLHAAGVRLGGEALLAVGPGGVGKSSLALAWSLLGHPVLGDDIVFLDSEGRAESFRRLFKVDPVRLASHGIELAATPGWEEGSSEAWFDPRAAGGWSSGPVPVGAVVVLDRRGDDRDSGSGERPKLTGVQPAESLNDLLASVVFTGRSPGESVDPLLAMLDGCDVVRLSFASSARAARHLVERFGAGSEDRSGGGVS